MKNLIQLQTDLLTRLKNLLEEEKAVLIQEDGRRLAEIVCLKEGLQTQLADSENRRKEIWGDAGLKEKASELGGAEGRELLVQGEALRELAHETRELQETNSMLTRQSEAYGNRLMSILQQAARKNGVTYGKGGTVTSQQGVKASMDRSV